MRNYVQKTDLNKLHPQERANLKKEIIAQIQADEGENFFNTLSKRDFARLNDLLPYDEITFADMVELVRGSGVGSGTSFGVTVYLAAKLVLSGSQFSLSISGGEILITRH